MIFWYRTSFKHHVWHVWVSRSFPINTKNEALESNKRKQPVLILLSYIKPPSLRRHALHFLAATIERNKRKQPVLTWLSDIKLPSWNVIFCIFASQIVAKYPPKPPKIDPRPTPSRDHKGFLLQLPFLSLLASEKLPPRPPRRPPKPTPWPCEIRSKIDLPSKRDTGPSSSEFRSILGPQNGGLEVRFRGHVASKMREAESFKNDTPPMRKPHFWRSEPPE